MTLGFIGLGKMGSRMVRKLAGEHTVVVWNRSAQPVQALVSEGVRVAVAQSIEDLVDKLPAPRIVWVMVPAGEATDAVLGDVAKLIGQGDIMIDGGNSLYKDTERRAKEFSEKGIRFLGIGVSGGLVAATAGYPLMVGGDQSAYEEVKPILDTLAHPNGGHTYVGPGGAGHFVKMVHNAIEYGYMQSLGEGFAILEKSPYDLNLLEIAKLYQKGTLLSGFMMDRAAEALAPDSGLADVAGIIEESGEARWAIEAAKELGVPTEVIEASLAYRRRSQTDPAIQSSFTAKLIAALRKAFGGHALRTK